MPAARLYASLRKFARTFYNGNNCPGGGERSSPAKAHESIRVTLAREIYESIKLAGWDEVYARLQKVVK